MFANIRLGRKPRWVSGSSKLRDGCSSAQALTFYKTYLNPAACCTAVGPLLPNTLPWSIFRFSLRR